MFAVAFNVILLVELDILQDKTAWFMVFSRLFNFAEV